MSEIVDLKTLKPEELVIRIADKNINISNIPFEIALDVIEKVDELKEDENYSKRKLMLIFQDIVIKVLHEADSSIDEKWVRKNVNAFQMMRLIDRIVNPILDGLGIGGQQNNTKSLKKK
jgi:hypothetical protein